MVRTILSMPDMDKKFELQNSVLLLFMRLKYG